MSAAAFFILGNPRSGTSLFRSILNAQSGLVVPPECGFALWLRSEWTMVDWTSERTLGAFAEAVQECRKFETWSMTTSELIASLNERPITGYADAVSRIYEAYGRKRGGAALMWGDKNNYYIGQVPELKELFPDARFVHIVRDVRDVACSYLELATKDITSKYKPVLSTDPAAIAEEWRINNLAALNALEGTPEYFRIRYEDLVSDVAATITDVLKFLGSTEPMSVTKEAHIGSLDEPAEFMQWKSKLSGPVDGSSVGRYRKDLPVDARAIIEADCGQLLARFGYTVPG